MKKIISLFILSLFIMLNLSSCGASPIYVNTNNGENSQTNKIGTFINIGIIGSGDYLCYDEMTQIVYLNQVTYNGYNIYTPYYAPNGLPYRYNPITNTFEEIDNQISGDDTNEDN